MNFELRGVFLLEKIGLNYTEVNACILCRYTFVALVAENSINSEGLLTVEVAFVLISLMKM